MQIMNMEVPAIEVQNAFKSYGKDEILTNLCMRVNKGSIYGLLGHSGCGKTTILSCITGLKDLDRGRVLINGRTSGHNAKSIGYMPQEIALQEKFTIREVLTYYARIYRMSASDTKSRIDFLIEFLHLPKTSQLIMNLSGGEQRRTSLATAMINDPTLLILDEPTVGLDPLLREKIWNYLCKKVSVDGTTILITTHYIEEAKQFDMVGLMRNGRLLAEASPKTLLEQHETHFLQDVVLKLIKTEEVYIAESSFPYEHNDTSLIASYKNNPNANEAFNSLDSIKSEEANYPPTKNFLNTTSDHLHKIYTIIRRNYLSKYRHRLFLVIILLLPSFVIGILDCIIGKEPINSKIAVVNEEFNTLDFLEICQRRNNSCFNAYMSCNFFQQFSTKKIFWIPFLSEKEALESVEKGDNNGFMVIPANFTSHMVSRLTEGRFVSNESLDGSELSIHLDMSNYITSAYIRKEITEEYLNFLQSLISDCDLNPDVIKIPLKLNTIYGDLNRGLSEFTQPPVLLLIIWMLPMVISCVYIIDRKKGTLDRSLVAGVEHFHIITASIFTEGTVIILELTVCFTFLFLCLDFHIKGSFFLAFLLCFLMGVCGLSFGCVLGPLCNHEFEALFCIIAVYIPTLTLSGLIWPIPSTPVWARFVINCLPLTQAVESLRSIVSRGWGLSHSHVYPGFALVIAWTAFFFILSSILFKFRSK